MVAVAATADVAAARRAAGARAAAVAVSSPADHRRRDRRTMLQPKRTKHRKAHRGRRAGMAKGGTRVEFGEYGLKALDRGWITNRQIEAARIAMTRKIKRGGKAWINIFPDKPVTPKPAGPHAGPRKGHATG